MKTAYPILMHKGASGMYVVRVPDLDIGTQGEDIADAIYMARDAISLWGICEQDDGRPIPPPSNTIPEHEPNEIPAFVDVDFDEYRRKIDNRTVRKNITLPSWLNEAAEKAGVNFSAVMQTALKEQLHIER